MTSKTITAGTVIYESAKDTVSSLDIITKGMVRATGDYCTIDLAPGSIIGIGELPGDTYIFTYEVSEDVTVYSYPYESEASLVAMLKGNPKLLATLVASSVRFAKNMQSAVLDTIEFARTEYARLQKSLEEYPSVAIAAGITPRTFDDLASFKAPEMLDKAKGWHRDFVEDLYANEAQFRQGFYPIPSIGLGIGLTVNMYALESRDFMAEVIEYINAFTRASRDFKNHYLLTKEKAAAVASKGAEALAENGDESVRNCLAAINEFASPDAGLFDSFSSLLEEFIGNTDRYGSADATRKLRRDLAAKFYDLYTEVFLKAVSVSWDSIPLAVRMFLIFGYVDETLAGSDYANMLAAITSSISPGSDKKVVTIFEWLKHIYEGSVMPSKNEFDLDYPAYIRELKREGRITAAAEKQLLNSMEERLKFEIKNLFMIGNRVTFGRITTFVPVFDKENVTKAIDQSYLSPAVVNETINKIRSIDFTAFCRQGVFSMPEAGVNSFFTTDEVLPYVILMPNIGTRATLWQEIDSKKRSTPARMIISILHTETFEDTMIRLVGEFRWEMCKTEQGVHWNDVTDPSLTALYCDYLQFYRKNSALSVEVREKISVALKNNANNFKKVFISDYFTYIKYESQCALRLNKLARSILFQFCPFSGSIVSTLGDNPQYTQLIAKHTAGVKQKQKMLSNLCTKFEKAGCNIPPEIRAQIRFWSNE
ncbi:MAG: hypothetical protein K5857_02545 [Lachnospiraceae bacterium]|nr:hypothetical protein [Lachnospiraceae bacterium]